jgi:AraC-like DNA-binding protein
MLFSQFRPHPQLSEAIDSILLQEDFSEHNYANRNPVKVLPSTLAVIGIQYGKPMTLLEDGKEKLLSTSGLTGLQSSYREYRSTGGIGTILVRFKPGGLSCFTPYPLHEFRDANIDLRLLFPPSAVAEMEEKLQAAAEPAERIAAVESFLCSLYRQHSADQMLLHISALLQKQNGLMSIDQLAKDFYISRRTLERKFQTGIGIPPKKFAGILRFQHSIQLRKAGYEYLDIVASGHFTDQAHFVHDFQSFAGCSPGLFFLSGPQPELSRHFAEDYAGTPARHTMYH